jgi:hypothetical protein
MYNMDNNHHCNAINENGEIGVLKLRHKAKLALQAVIDSLRKKGIEPLSGDNGRFFVINRTGTALETTFTVTVKSKTVSIDGQEFEQQIVHKLTPEIIARLESEAADLDYLYVRPSSEVVAQIVAESDLLTGRSPNIDALLKPQNAETTDEGDQGEEEPQASAPAQTTAPASQPAQAAAPAQAPAQSLSQPAPTPTSAPAVTVQVQATPAPKASTPSSEMSDEEFLKSLQA